MSDEFDDVEEPGLVSRSHGLRVEQPADQVPALISEVYGEATQPLRAQLLECLLRPVGPLALGSIAAGAFGAFLMRGHTRSFVVTLDDVARISSTQILELARFVEQCGPETFQRLGALLAQHPMGMAALGGSAWLLLMRALGRPVTEPADPAAEAATDGGLRPAA